jgi:hypothetical protein
MEGEVEEGNGSVVGELDPMLIDVFLVVLVADSVVLLLESVVYASLSVHLVDKG